jgi:asparagine synthase (glutamine-hydrolysing)
MCGIAGVWSTDPRVVVDAATIRRMTDTLVHRGPDGQGVRVGPGFGLGHRRLAIVDLEGGRQPMDDVGEQVGANPRVVVTFNGEIYNHHALRRELETEHGVRFTTRCDTEVLVHGWAVWGERLPERLHGMFAFAVVDLARRAVFAARDRAGKKPLHYAVVRRAGEPGGTLVFGSEPKALLTHPDVSHAFDPVALTQALCLRYVPDPRTAFEAIRRLPPGHRLIWREDDAEPRLDAYWRLPAAASGSEAFADRDEARAGFLALLDEVVEDRLMADVPLGAFLSGGIDSQMVVDAMARIAAARGGAPPTACTMGFDDPRMDERPYARDAAEMCGAVLREGVVDPAAMTAVRGEGGATGDMAWADVLDEPFADASVIPTFHVSRLARRHVTVALSGDGGDESFGGYRRYRFDVVENRVRALMPSRLWSAAAAVYPKADFLPRAVRLKRTFANLARSPDLAYARSVSAVLPEEVRPLLRGDLADVAAAHDPLAPVRDAWQASADEHPLDRAVSADFATWLPGDVLTKVDRASMAVSLEVRCPLLDHRMIEWARRMPASWKLRAGTTKAFLRETLVERLGEAALRRPKQGFHVPLRSWMRGPVGDALEMRTREESRFAAGLIDPAGVRAALAVHRSGQRDFGELLWAVTCLDRFVQQCDARAEGGR